jgi:hypothetical protein
MELFYKLGNATGYRRGIDRGESCGKLVIMLKVSDDLWFCHDITEKFLVPVES